MHNRKTQYTDQQEWRMARRRTSEVGPEEALGGIRTMKDKRGAWASLVAQTRSACSAVDLGLIPESGRSPREGNGYPLQYSCLENPMDRGAWQATVHGITNSGGD